ncbi:MAG TPA: ABC transporter substrate-binding protein [Candidatus Limiplasma sp.]|nr:ABC transporter substrate-binding protein [Candidatus Limiplasma sp.]HRX08122.1 ABC transporter substrate-binding protein [Candidatus Limiplasma sp.]
MRKILVLLVTAMTVLTLLGGAALAETTHTVFADAGWDSIRLHNAVAAYIGETAYALDTEEISGSTPITYAGLINGDVSVYMELWTDNLASYSDDIAAGKFVELGVNFDDNAQGFYVPRYVIEGDAERGIEPMAPDLKSVADLKNYADVFVDPEEPDMGRIYGAISSWDIDLIMRSKYEFYGINETFNYMDPGSDAALAAAFASAYKKGEAIVGYYWEPTWLTGKYDLVLLEDAPYDPELYPLGQCECPSVAVTIGVSNDFYAAAPEFCEFLSKYHTSSALTAEALTYIMDNDASYEDAAKWFLAKNDALLDEWLPADKAQLVRDALAAE